MVAQDVNTRTKVEIQAAAMNALIEVLDGDDDSNVAKTLSACQIKDPSLIMSLTDEEIGELKINKRTDVRLSGTRIKWYDHVFGVNQPTKGQ